MYDLLIRNGDVIDGTGAPARRADVAVRGDRIVAIEAGLAEPTRNAIDARGHVVAPGFIDIKTHSDLTLPLYPRAESRVYQGVTTELVGSCGFTAAPVPPSRLGAVSDYFAALAPALKLRETSFAAYVESFPATSVNVAFQVGHNTVRVGVIGLEKRAPTTQEQATMERLVEEALDSGAVAVSSGPFTAPGAFAGPQELEAFAHVAARYGAGYSTHVRDEASGLFDAVREAVAVAERTGVRTRIVHIKLSGTENWGGAPRLLDELAVARARGVPVDCDEYPYTIAVNPLRNLLPIWVQEGGTAGILKRIVDPRARDDIRADIATRGLNAFGRIPSWEAVRVTMSPGTPDEVGHTIADIAARRGCDPVDALCAILFADGGATRGLIDAMHEQDIRAFVACPWVLVGSDGRAFGPAGPLARELPHPRFYGTFARILGHYTRDLGLLTLPQAIHKMTGAPAAALGLRDRGVLHPGAAADITVFDPVTITDRATFDKGRATGVEYAADGGVHVMTAAREVILSGGAVNSPQLLQLSGVGDPDHLTQLGVTVTHDLKGVGRNLQDHPAMTVKQLCTQPISLLTQTRPITSAIQVARYFITGGGPAAYHGGEAQMLVKTRPDVVAPDLQYFMTNILYTNNGRTIIDKHGFMTYFTLQRPGSRGTVKIRSADPAAPPAIDLNYCDDPNDIATIREGIGISRRLFAQPAFAPYRGEEYQPGVAAQSDAELDAYIRSEVTSNYHLSGTCKMGSDPLAVVDHTLRVRGLEGLVIDASIMPRVISGNTNAPTIMIAEKGAQTIIDGVKAA